jgi:hypothetical protein
MRRKEWGEWYWGTTWYERHERPEPGERRYLPNPPPAGVLVRRDRNGIRRVVDLYGLDDVTFTDAARILGVSTMTIYRWADDGILKTRRRHGVRVVQVRELARRAKQMGNVDAKRAMVLDITSEEA